MITYRDYEGLELRVDYDYQPKEPRTRDYPGCQSDVQINSVEIVLGIDGERPVKDSVFAADMVDILDILATSYIEELAQDILDEIEMGDR